MDREGVSRFPGAEGRIPNFAGAKLAAQKLAGHRLWKPAKVIKANPDSPQTHARRIALEEGKKIVMAVPRLRDQHPFRVLDPARLTKAQVREAATIKGALRHGKVVALEEVPKIDFVLCGSVAVNLSGARLGKGGGFSDLEYGMLIEEGKIGDRTQVATTVHPIQILREHLMITDHDLPVDLIATPRGRDRGRANLRAPEGHPLGPPAATPDPRDPGPGADGVRVTAWTSRFQDSAISDAPENAPVPAARACSSAALALARQVGLSATAQARATVPSPWYAGRSGVCSLQVPPPLPRRNEVRGDSLLSAFWDLGGRRVLIPEHGARPPASTERPFCIPRWAILILRGRCRRRTWRS